MHDAPFRPAEAKDVPALVALGIDYFHESEISRFTTYAADSFEKAMASAIEHPGHDIIVFCPDGGPPRGFISYSLDFSYTKEPLALLSLLYVAPEYRKTPVGRCLVRLATSRAKDRGAVLFYAGGMSGIPEVEKTIANLFRKMGFEDLAFWGRKVL